MATVPGTAAPRRLVLALTARLVPPMPAFISGSAVSPCWVDACSLTTGILVEPRVATAS
jgi:hypothetical protein